MTIPSRFEYDPKASSFDTFGPLRYKLQAAHDNMLKGLEFAWPLPEGLWWKINLDLENGDTIIFRATMAPKEPVRSADYEGDQK